MIEIPKDKVQVPRASFMPGQPIVDPGLRQVAALQNRLWARGGGCWSVSLNTFIWSPTWTTENGDNPGFDDLDQFSPVIKPGREEVDAYRFQPPARTHHAVTVSAFVAGEGDIEVSLHAVTAGQAISDTPTYVQEMSSPYDVSTGGTIATTFMVPLDAAPTISGYQVRFRARAPLELHITALAVHSHRYISESTLDDVVLWGTPGITDDDVDPFAALEWENDGLGLGFTGAAGTSPAVGDPPDLPVGVRYAERAGGKYLSSAPFSLAAAEGLIFAVAIRPRFLSSITGTIASKAGVGGPSVAIYMVDDAIYARARFSSINRTVQVSGLVAEQWYDVVVWRSSTLRELRIFVNGTAAMVSAPHSVGINDTTSPLFLLRSHDGVTESNCDVAMPYLAAGDFSPVEVDQVRTWRRSILGCW